MIVGHDDRMRIPAHGDREDVPRMNPHSVYRADRNELRLRKQAPLRVERQRPEFLLPFADRQHPAEESGRVGRRRHSRNVCLPRGIPAPRQLKRRGQLQDLDPPETENLALRTSQIVRGDSAFERIEVGFHQRFDASESVDESSRKLHHVATGSSGLENDGQKFRAAGHGRRAGLLNPLPRLRLDGSRLEISCDRLVV